MCACQGRLSLAFKRPETVVTCYGTCNHAWPLPTYVCPRGQAHWDVVPFEEFSIRLRRADLPNIVDIIEAVTPEQFARLQVGCMRGVQMMRGSAKKLRSIGSTYLDPQVLRCMERLRKAAAHWLAPCQRYHCTKKCHGPRATFTV